MTGVEVAGISAECFPLAFALGAGSQMLQPLAIAVIGELLLSIFLSPVITPVIYYLTKSIHSKGLVIFGHYPSRQVSTRSLISNLLIWFIFLAKFIFMVC
jgi:hypothetical protein